MHRYAFIALVASLFATTARAQDDIDADVLMVSKLLRALDRSDEALTLVQAALDRLAAASSSQVAFVDQDKKAYAAHLEKALILVELGRADEAVAVVGKGRQTLPSSSAGITQGIDLGGCMITAGHPEQGLQQLALPVFDDPTKVGSGQRAYVHSWRACADALLGRPAALASELDYLTKHRRDNVQAELAGFLCADKEEAFAAEMASLLEDPFQRESAPTIAQRVRLTPASGGIRADVERAPRKDTRPSGRASGGGEGRPFGALPPVGHSLRAVLILYPYQSRLWRARPGLRGPSARRLAEG